MRCATVKEGAECAMMKEGGCAYLGGACRPVVERCAGCERTISVDGQTYCQPFPDPAAKWRLDSCSMATHLKVEGNARDKVRVGQQKQKKR